MENFRIFTLGFQQPSLMKFTLSVCGFVFDLDFQSHDTVELLQCYTTYSLIRPKSITPPACILLH